MPHKYDAIPKDIKAEMSQIVYQFSPESLTCDGELSHSSVQLKVNRLSREWNTLVKKTGISVDFDEFESYIYI